MPTLHWIGKEKVVNHHQNVPYKILEHQYGFSADAGKQDGVEIGGGNKIIHGDNLEALKSLLPQYEDQIKCIYIDPPYNTGNESWVYNDNVNDPKIKKWINQVVGKEGDDLSRHDKWLCMMYPRLQLLYKLLKDDGIIFVSIDEFEFDYLGLILDEIFGRQNRIECFVWKKTYGGGAKSKHVVNIHEYVYCYCKDLSKIKEFELPPDEEVLKYYKYQDAKFPQRGPYRLQPLATTSMDDRPNLKYPIVYNGEEILPKKQWQWSRERTETALANDDLVIERNTKTNQWSVNYKQYLIGEDGQQRGKKMFSIIEGIYTQHGTNELNAIFNTKSFNFPKPSELIKQLILLTTDKSSIILDSFAGSGTTANAVLNLNKQDGGDRKFILIEMDEYADYVTAERVKKVMEGYEKVEGTGGDFDFYILGKPLFRDDDSLNEDVPEQKIREYVYYSETKQPLPQGKSNKKSKYLLHKLNETAYYFYYEKESLTTLDNEFLGSVKTKAGQYIIYADNCLLDKAFMQKKNIIFKKIPRDITRF